MAVTTDLEIANLALARLGQDAIASIDNATRDSTIVNRLFNQNREYCLALYHWVSITYDIHLARAAKISISGITQASPMVVTCSGHAYVTGDFVTLEEVNGMTDVNLDEFVVNAYTSSTLTLYLPSGSLTDATGYSAYTSGGFVYRYAGDSWGYVYDLPSGTLKVVQVLDEYFGLSNHYTWARVRDLLYTDQQYAGVRYVKRVTDATLYEEQLVELMAARLAWLVAMKIADDDTYRRVRQEWADISAKARMDTERQRGSAPKPETAWEKVW